MLKEQFSSNQAIPFITSSKNVLFYAVKMYKNNNSIQLKDIQMQKVFQHNLTCVAKTEAFFDKLGEL